MQYNIRNLAFWTTDKIKGSPVKKHIDEIKNIIEDPYSHTTDKLRHRALNELILHATKTCRFYKDLNHKTDLSNFPVIDKIKIRENIDSFVSNAYNNADLFSIVTSGSTGTPFQVYQDANKRRRNSADTIYFASRAGYDVGEKLFYLKIWSASNSKSSLTARIQNVVPFDVLKFNDEEIGRFLQLLSADKSKKGILGYASSLELIAKYLDKVGDTRSYYNTGLQSAISMSEALSDYTKDRFKRYFGIELLARYSNLENGIIAQQYFGGESKYRINTASYFVEIFKLNEDILATPGEMGRIVVTDLHNFGMPMIRYDTGDIGKFHVGKDGQLDENILDHIEGRKLDLLFDTKGSLVSSYIMYKNMWKYTEITQYQLIQSGRKEYRFKINADSKFAREEELTKEFKSYLGEDADFTIEYVSEIPLLSSGKRKKIINTYYNK